MRVTFHQKRSSFCVVLKTWGEQEEFSSVKVIIPQGGKRLWEKFCDFDLAKSFDVVDSGKIFPEKCSQYFLSKRVR